MHGDKWGHSPATHPTAVAQQVHCEGVVDRALIESEEENCESILGAHSSQLVADESTPTTAGHVESIIVGQLHEAKHAAATEPSSAVSVWVLEDHNHHLNDMLHRLPVAELRKLCRKCSVD